MIIGYLLLILGFWLVIFLRDSIRIKLINIIVLNPNIKRLLVIEFVIALLGGPISLYIACLGFIY